ncbi:GH36-type glycosyl hydrolase domain-containing protein [Thermohalobacter berrensis]|uniref:GH36-type glycosyl hydrolase domain-containing protein n=1 Tax=Thermohalobacter berrensis TaxID=99594 RepID=UPI0024319F02|nr:hypothetical protein [Thermohalobacter berrensis]
MTRWRSDLLTHKYGNFIFLKNEETGEMWSATYDPLNKEPDGYKVRFSQDKAEYIRADDNIDTHTEVIVTSEDDAEIRRVRLTNHGEKELIIELTSYFETVLTNQSADIAHPAFSNLFVRTEALDESDTIIASRRPREEGQKTVWAFHSVVVEGETLGSLQYETNRDNFIGRGRDISNPQALTQPLSNTTGVVIDPIMSLRKKIKIKPGETAKVSFITGVGNNKKEVIELSRKYTDTPNITRAFDLAFTRSQVENSYLNVGEEDIKLFQEIVPHIVFLSPNRKKYKNIIKKNTKGQSGLWAYGISGDNPIILLTIKDAEYLDVLRKVLKSHEYFRMKGLTVDLVILNEDKSNYFQPLYHMIKNEVSESNSRHIYSKPGGIYIVNANSIPDEDKILLYSSAGLILRADNVPLLTQLREKNETEKLPNEKEFKQSNIIYMDREKNFELSYFNGYGGFSLNGREYIIKLMDYNNTPAPWINVVSNGKFGFQVSESGSGFTWSENSRENKLTPWSNDPVSDPPGEIIYIRDEQDGHTWSITPLPIREGGTYIIKHGQGYSTFIRESNGLEQELTMFVPLDEPAKINLVKLKNNSNIRRKISLTYYIRPVLGVIDEMTQQHIITEIDEESGAILIKNPYNPDFPGRIAFVNTSEVGKSYTGDREEFIGIDGSLKNPEALKRETLSNRLGAGFDPCGAIQTVVEIDPDEEKEVVFILGQGKSIDEVRKIVNKYTQIANCTNALTEVKNYWNKVLETIEVSTPDKSMDIMLNHWLLYQTIACRLWARSAFYQSGGAYGFRDQLQDAMNSINVLPEATKKQIILHSAHQFVEGDVQHWWHKTGVDGPDKGIRTKFSDDLLWLPLATAEYVKKTGDYSILEEKVGYLESEPLKENEDEKYDIPRFSDESSTIYEHCIRAIDRSLKYGEHGIPLMGSGDWNDGMNKVGNKGKGESIWLGWFICTILKRFIPICKEMKDFERAKEYSNAIEKITRSIEENAWDGNWYRRAYFDDGTPLGSSENTECIIDSIAQSWSIISGSGKKDRVKSAMESVERYLIKEDEGLILLFTPPFDKTEHDPGYIKGYVPGVRENGGQYTHAATWVVNAYALMGKGDRAWKLYNMINPINHSRTSIECSTYKVEPYVMAADVYAVSPHVGRGGWTWYTGAAGWMYTVGIEYILGFKKEGNKLIIDPCIPRDWLNYKIKYRYENTVYKIVVKNPNRVNKNVVKVILDGKELKEKYIPLVNDNKEHKVEVVLG